MESRRVPADALQVGSETLVIRSLVAESKSGDLRLDGALMFGESGGYDLKYRSRIDLSELRKWWDRSPPLVAESSCPDRSLAFLQTHA